MIKLLLLICLCVFFILPSKADWIEINSFNKVLAFSKIAKAGKVSIFIITTNWCLPCKTLIEGIKDQHFDMDKIDIYIVDMAPIGYTYKDLDSTEAYKTWRAIEGLKSWPTVYVANQNTNLMAVFDDKGNEKSMVSRLTIAINDLLDKNSFFNKKALYTSHLEKTATINDKSKKYKTTKKNNNSIDSSNLKKEKISPQLQEIIKL